MKNHSEQILLLCGSIFLVGLIFADILIQQTSPKQNPADGIANMASLPPAPTFPDPSVDIRDKESHSDDPVAVFDSETIHPPQTGETHATPPSLPADTSTRGSNELDAWAVESQPPPPVRHAEQKELQDASQDRVAWYQSNTSNISPVQFNIFFNALRPYGRWFKHANHGACWIPQASQIDAQWRPYLSGGKWTYNDGAWLWVSDYRWGAYPFHYGRWFHTSKGWAWKPEGQWSTAWVSWRNGGEHCGWAPLAPTDKEVAASVASTLKHRVDPDQLTADHYVFVPKEHLLDATLPREILDSEQSKKVFADSSKSDYFYMGKARRWFNRGVPVQDISSKIQMAESTPQKGEKYQIPTNSNQRQTGSLNPVAGYRQFGGGTVFGNGQGVRGGSNPVIHPSPSPAPVQQGTVARQVTSNASGKRMDALVRAERTPTVANYNRVQTAPVQPKYSR